MQEPRPPEPPVAGAQASNTAETTLAAIAAEQIPGRHLRRALQIAKIHGIAAKSELDAVRLLREAGIDPFSLVSMVRIVSPEREPNATAHDSGVRSVHENVSKPMRLPGDTITRTRRRPKRAQKLPLDPSKTYADDHQADEILRFHQVISQRRRRRLTLLGKKLFAFVLLPTFFFGWYFYMIATPMYSVQSEFFIQQADQTSSGRSLGGLLPGASPDSFAVQGYLQSREAMVRLDKDSSFRAHFENEKVDPLQRLSPDATLETVYKVYKKFITVSFDTKDEVIRMNVVAADPKVAANWSRQLIGYAEGQVDQLSQRLKADQMRDALQSYDTAAEAVSAAQRSLIELQQKFKIISGRMEVGLVVSQLGILEDQVVQDRLSLAQLEGNSEPSQARMEPVKRRILALEAQIATLRARMTGDSANEVSLAEMRTRLLQAEVNLKDRQLFAAKALLAVETARAEANRQSSYLLVSVSPIPPDEPTYPHAFQYSLVTMLIFLGIYLVASVAVQNMREQFSI